MKRVKVGKAARFLTQAEEQGKWLDMSRGKQKFTQRDVVRAIKAARAAGLDVRGFEVDASGTIRVRTDTDADGRPQSTDGNEWDSVK